MASLSLSLILAKYGGPTNKIRSKRLKPPSLRRQQTARLSSSRTPTIRQYGSAKSRMRRALTFAYIWLKVAPTRPPIAFAQQFKNLLSSIVEGVPSLTFGEQVW